MSSKNGGSKFSEDLYDRKIAKITYTNHLNYLMVNKYRKYDNWLEKNEKHLHNMYEISNLSCSFEEFCDFVFLNS